MERLAHEWQELLKQPGDHSSGFIRIRLPECTSCGLYAALRKPENSRALLLEINARSLPKGYRYPESIGFEVSSEPLGQEAEHDLRVYLLLTDDRYSDIFAVLASDIAEMASKQATEREAVEVFISQLTRWQTFLRKYKPEGLSEQQQKGLYGELWFLRHHVLTRLTPALAVESWVGQKGMNQDFNFSDFAVEVKMTSNPPHQIVKIANVRQLDGTGVDKLALFHLALDVRQGGEQSLPELVEELRKVIGDQDTSALVDFEGRLVEAGYLSIHEERYQLLTYAHHYSNYYMVDEGFPRLLEQNIPDGVGDVRYSISLAQCRPYEIDEDVAGALIEGHNNE